MKDEIQAGLKNAIERGDDLDEAVKSFINAGYNPVEVKEAARGLEGVSKIVEPESSQEKKEKPKLNPSFGVAEKKQEVPEEKPEPAKPIEEKKEEYYAPEKYYNKETKPVNTYFQPTPVKSGGKYKTLIISLMVALILLIILLVAGIIFFDDIVKILGG